MELPIHSNTLVNSLARTHMLVAKLLYPSSAAYNGNYVTEE